ncbi:hypothetical protein K439DRAFT_1652874 [Ramaria rubella]|nr:hypothetical protein K439DRAFT_1652874 [Ramaria rubella]
MISRLYFRLLVFCAVLLVLTSLFLSRDKLNVPDDFRLRHFPNYHANKTQDDSRQFVTPDETKNCDRCLVSSRWCSEFGSKNMDLSVAYEGTGERLRRALAKSQRGEPIKFGIIGGSLSRGHGCHCTTFHRQIFNWWNETYPHPDNLYIDGSVGARGSNYFKFCHGEHLRPDLDVVILELSINDRLDVKDTRNVESILRSVLSYPSQPAVVITASFSLMDKIEMGNDAHLPVAQYYDVPVINMRNSLLPIIYQYPEMMKTYFAWEHPEPPRVDILHFSKLGHTALAKTTIALIQRQACILNRGRPTMAPDPAIFPSGEDYSLSVPRQRMTDKFNPSVEVTSPIDRPTCMSIDSTRNPLMPLPITTDHGWEPWTLPRTTKQYLRATEPGSRVSFEVELTSGQVAIYYLRSRSMGLGRAKCWFNNDERRAKELDGWWDRAENVGDFTPINELPMTIGKHQVHCETLPKSGNEEGRGSIFLLIAVMTI